jgi:hypothetical protein
MSGTQFAMVSGWMQNGNISQFVSAHPDINRFELVSLRFWVPDVALIADEGIFAADGRSGGLGSHARARNDSRGLERGTFSFSGIRPTICL